MMQERIKHFAQTQPQQIAFCSEEETLTYGTLWTQANVRADCLRRQGTAPVILFRERKAQTLVSMLACLIARRAYVPVHPDTPLLRLERIATLSGAGLVLTPEMPALSGVDCCASDRLDRYAALPAQHCDSAIAYIIFTSGSTGTPKGVPISRRNLDHFTAWITQLPPLDELRQGSVFNQASFSFDLSVAALCYALHGGHTLVMMNAENLTDCDRIVSTFLKQKVQVAVLTPSFLKLCLLHPQFNADALPDLRCVYLCGEVLEKPPAQRLLSAFPKLALLNAYGPTEATSAVSAIRITADLLSQQTLLPVGDAASFATQIEIDNGEIVLRGESVFGGYLGGVRGGFQRVDGQPVYRTGDCGFIRDNQLYCTGRMDRQVKLSGYRIELDEIESQLCAIPGVLNAAVVAKKTPQGAVKSIQAFVVLQDGLTTAQVRTALAARLLPYMMPKTIRALPRLPVNENGKIDRKALMTLSWT